MGIFALPAASLRLPVDVTIASDLTMTNANTLYDGPSAVFAAGTWDIRYKVSFTTAGTATHEFGARLWDGTTTYDESELDSASIAAGFQFSVVGFAIVTLNYSTTLKVSVSDIRNTSVLKRDVIAIAGIAGTSHTATRLIGIPI